MKSRFGIMALAALLLAGPAAAINVQTELMCLVDVSGSIDATEFNLQKTGYVNAFTNATVQALIGQATGGIAASVVYWSGTGQQTFAANWTHLTNATSCNNFASVINGFARPFSNNTAPGSAINFGNPTFWSNNFDSQFQIMDVSGDGEQNEGSDTSDARDAAVAAGIDKINGLVIGGDPSVFNFYVNNIQAGAGSFTAAAADFNAFGAAILTKIQTEVGPVVPEPSTFALLGLGMIGVIGGAIRRRK